jgi:hypothetical protein
MIKNPSEKSFTDSDSDLFCISESESNKKLRTTDLILASGLCPRVWGALVSSNR